MKKIALITGASGGIGSAVARQFAFNGYAVALVCNHNRQAIEHLIDTFPDQTDYLAISCDLTDRNSVLEMIETVHNRLGLVSVLVNCAGAALPQKLFSDTSDEEYHRIFDINVFGTMRLTRLLINDLREKHGTVINISSVWGVTGGSCEVIYSASKASLIGFTKALAKELGTSDITVNAVAPGLIPTAMNAHLSQNDIDAFCDETPLNRVGTSEDIAEAVFYLANARFVTGQVISCDGGYTV